MPRLFALDSMAILYRNYFAMIRSPLINSKGLNTSGIYGFFNQIVKIMETESPEYLAVVSDSSEPTFRHNRFPEYKATREKMPDDLVEQLAYLPRLVEALNLPFIIMPGYEADDIIGTLIRVCREQNIEGLMVTSDKDYMQLISETTQMFNHKNQKVGIKQVYEKFGCLPDQVIDILGLMGDASDNVPGVKGVGEKTAIKLIDQFGSIPNLYESIDQLPPSKMKEKLINDKANALLSRELVTIDVNVPLEVSLSDLSLKPTDLYNNEELIDILEELEFKTFLKRLRPDSSGPKSKKPSAPEEPEEPSITVEPIEARRMESVADFERLLASLDDHSVLAFDITSQTEDMIEASISGLVMTCTASEVWYLPVDSPALIPHRAFIFDELKKILAADHITKVVYNWKRILHLLWQEAVTTGNTIFDVMLAAHLVESDERDYSLPALITRQLKVTKKYHLSTRKENSSEGQLVLESSGEDYYISHAENVGLLWQMYPHLFHQLEQTHMLKTYQYVEIRLAEVLTRLEQNGVKIDTDMLRNISTEFEHRLNTLTAQIHETAEESFNINSVPELQQVLYEKLKLHEVCGVRPKKIKTGNKMSTDEETLDKMRSHPLPGKILQYRELNKLKNTYVDQLPTFIHRKTGQIHSSFRQTVAATGRLASDKPNLQNIPIRAEDGRRIRSAFIPRHPDNVLISADYSQIELRVVAHFSKDPTFMDAYRHNLDIHTLTAAAIFDLSEDQVDRDMRSKAKEVNFGLIYRMGPERLSMITHTSKAEAKKFIERYFQKYATIHALQEHFLERARKEGFAQTMMGRRRYLPAINGRGLHRRMAEGAAVNTPIQGTAAEIIKLAMIAINRRLQTERLATEMILTVHDELVFDTPKSEVDEVMSLVKHEMESVLYLEVPLVAELGVGDNWLEAH